MKRTLIALALVAIAGTAGAQTAIPPVTPPAAGSAGVGAQTATPPSVSGYTVAPPAASSGAVTTPPVNPPTMSTSGVNATPAMAPNTANAPALPNAAGSNGAAKRIQADGYKNVQGLTRGTDGKWHGTAMRGNTMVGVVVDGRGNASSQ